MTRASSRARIGAGRDVSGVVTGVTIRYVRQRAGQTGVKRLLAGAGDTRAPHSLEDPTSWSSLDQVVALFDSAARILHDPEVARHLGAELLDQFQGTEIAGLLQRAKSPEGLLSAAMTSFGRLSIVAIVEVLEARD